MQINNLVSSTEDFAILQAIVDKQLLTKRQTWELQALGVCFGDALTGHIPGLNWCLVTDEYGTDPTLRFKDTTTQFNALTMISKRVEDGREVDLAHIAQWLVDFIDKESSEFGRAPTTHNTGPEPGISPTFGRSSGTSSLFVGQSAFRLDDAAHDV